MGPKGAAFGQAGSTRLDPTLARTEGTLEWNQPEERHGFRSKKRIEEHLLTLNVILDQTLAMDQPLWIISVDLSKAFDRVNWELLWQAVGDHGVSPDVVWLLQNIYFQLVLTADCSITRTFYWSVSTQLARCWPFICREPLKDWTFWFPTSYSCS